MLSLRFVEATGLKQKNELAPETKFEVREKNVFTLLFRLQATSFLFQEPVTTTTIIDASFQAAVFNGIHTLLFTGIGS